MYVVMIHQRHRQTDGQKTSDSKTALCTVVHRAVKNDNQQYKPGQPFGTNAAKIFVGLRTVKYILAYTNGPRDALRHTQSSSCCAQSWALRVIDRRQSSVGSTVDNTWRQSMCRCKINLSSEVEEKLQWELRLCLEIFEFHICLINIP